MNAEGIKPILESLSRLGYPGYFASIVGIWTVLGAVALVVPGAPRIKEWAYAGFAFLLSGAAVSHAVSGDGLTEVLIPLILLGVVLASAALRPSRDGAPRGDAVAPNAA
jgi:uncharacterized membrane protein YphA (DoxX/SURF4 family)